MNLREMIKKYQDDGLNRILASARVSQDIVLKAIAEGSLNRNITIKGGVVLRSLTNDNRRATKDIDLDFIHYPISDEAIKNFVRRLDVLPELKIELTGDIEELAHQDYHGKRIHVKITDSDGYHIDSKIDIGVHKHFDIEQEEYCFDVCMDETGVSLLKNSNEQAFAEKLRSLLKFGPGSRRYKDIYDMYFFKDNMNAEKLNRIIHSLIFSDSGMRENTYSEIMKRVDFTFRDKAYLKRVSESEQRWMDEDINIIVAGIITTIKNLSELLPENP